ncbi:MAG: glycosyltransferase family 9 protein [Phycisphaerae bacterium]
MNRGGKALLIHQAALGDFLIACRLMEFCNSILGDHQWSYLGKRSHGRLGKALQIIDVFEDFDASDWYLLFTRDRPVSARTEKFLRQFDLILNVISGPETIFDRRLEEISEGRVFHIDPKMPVKFCGHNFEYLAGQLGIGAVGELPKTAFTVAPKILDQVRREIPTDRLVLLHPGASNEAKRWPLVKFIALADEIIRAGDEPGILLGEVELERFCASDLQLLKSKGRVLIDWPLEKVAALLSLSKGYVGNDNGISHLAGAVGAATKVIFVQNNFNNWRPLGPKVTVNFK